MHMLSKKDLSSEDLETLRRSRRSRNPTVVVTANRKVRTNEEAQVSVYDLGLFVTVQLLEETPAFLSLGKLCEEHGYSYEWVSGQKTTVDQTREKIICKADNFVPLVVQGLSTNPESSSSSTSTSRDVSSSGPAAERCDEPAPGNWRETNRTTQNQNKKRNGNRDSDDLLRDLPEWWEELTDNLEDTDMPVPAHIAQDSDSEGFLAEDALAKQYLEQKSLVTCRRLIAKSPMKRVNQETITGKLSWYKILPLNGFNLIRAKQLLRKRRRDQESFSSRRKSQKSFTLTTRWNLGEHVRFIMESPHFNSSSIRNKWYCWKSRTTSERRNLSSVVAIRIGCKVVDWFFGMLSLSAKCPRPFGRREKLLLEDDSENHSKDH